MKKYILTVLWSVTICSIASAQSSNHAVQIISPFANEEICLASSIPISASFKNNDTKSRTLVTGFKIYNVVTKTIVYSGVDTLNNISAGASIDTTFPPYITNPNILKQLGTFFACASITALDSVGHPILDWAFADSTCVRLFGIRTTALPFNDPSDGFSKTASGDIPDQTKWVSLGATVVDGDIETWDPPPPRYMSGSGGVGPDFLLSPVIRLDRRDAEGNLYSGSEVGDTLISFPFNLRGPTRVVLSFDFMRSGKHLYSGQWDADTMIGPEQTVLNTKGEVIRPGDSLIVEFKDTSEASCNPSPSGWKRIVGIDGGHDLEFQTFWINITDTLATYRLTGSQPKSIPIKQNYFNKGFRFRIRLKANNNETVLLPHDDDDAWYIDHIALEVPRRPDLEMTWVRIVTPYTKIPFSAASSLPIYFKVKNNESDAVIGFPVNVWITDSIGNTVYFQTVTVNNLRTGADSMIRMPDWNAQNAVNNSPKFIIHAGLASSFFDYYLEDNETYSIFYLNVEQGDHAIQEFAYDHAGITPEHGNGNDIPFLTKIKGQGIGFSNSSGSYAMKFTLSQSDTVFGARIYFASGNSAPDAIRISLLQGKENSCVPGDIVKQGSTEASFSDVRKGGLFDQFATYYFPKAMAVPAGVYWLSVSQLALDNFMMGGDLSRGGAVINVADSITPQITPIYSSPYGTQWSPTQNSGDVICTYALEVPAGSGNWQRWMPQTGWWPTNTEGNTHQAISWNPTVSAPYNKGGSFLPMIRVMVGSLGNGTTQVRNEHPKNFGFESISPNPLSPSSGTVELHFALSDDGHVWLTIYDEIGREIRSLVNSKLEVGSHTLHWDGKDASGNFVSPGVYLCRLSEGGRAASVKISVVK